MMEIQDKNNFLQQLLNIGLGKNTPASETKGDFAGLLNAAPEEPAAAENAAADLRAGQTFNADRVKERKDIPARDDKKEIKENDRSERREKAKSEKTRSEDAVPEEAAVREAQNDTQKAVAQPEEKVSAVPASGRETAPSVEAGVSAPVESGKGIVSVQSLLAPVMAADALSENIVLVPGTENGNAAEAEMLPATPVAKEGTENALLTEQAEYLDRKLAPSEKLQINVTVQEEKIAGPVVKDVLQNRFEIDALFQSVDIDAEAVLADADVGALASDVDGQPLLMTSKPAETLTGTAALKGFSAVEAPVVRENAVHQAVENSSNLAVSGKEVVFETANAVRGEAFSRINETSGRDAFKGMAKEVVEQIKVNITKSAVKGVDTIEIQLKPEDLGKIQIKMHIAKDGRLHADIISSRPETMDLLQRDVSGLEKAFNDAGYDTDGRSFNFSFQKENQAREQQNGDSGLLQFIGDTLEQEAGDGAGNDNLAWDPVLGLNIRV